MATRNNLKPVGLVAAPVATPTCANPVRAAARSRPSTGARAQGNQQDADQESGDPEHESPEHESP